MHQNVLISERGLEKGSSDLPLPLVYCGTLGKFLPVLCQPKVRTKFPIGLRVYVVISISYAQPGFTPICILYLFRWIKFVSLQANLLLNTWSGQH